MPKHDITNTADVDPQNYSYEAAAAFDDFSWWFAHNPAQCDRVPTKLWADFVHHSKVCLNLMEEIREIGSAPVRVQPDVAPIRLGRAG